MINQYLKDSQDITDITVQQPSTKNKIIDTIPLQIYFYERVIYILRSFIASFSLPKYFTHHQNQVDHNCNVRTPATRGKARRP